MRLPPNVNEWLNLLLRWFHVFSAILWVGSTYYFTWLDGRFQEEEREAGKASEVGGDAGDVEAAMTWLSGILLLTLVYYMGGGMIDADVRNIGLSTAVLFGVGMLVVGWVVYDLLVQSPLGRNEKAFAAVAYALVVGAAYLSDRKSTRLNSSHIP